MHVIKNLVRLRKARYKGLAKNTAQLFSLIGLANLVIAKRAVLAGYARGASCLTAGKRSKSSGNAALQELYAVALSSCVAALRCNAINSGCVVHSSASP